MFDCIDLHNTNAYHIYVLPRVISRLDNTIKSITLKSMQYVVYIIARGHVTA